MSNEIVHIFKEDYLRITNEMQDEIDTLCKQLKIAKQVLEICKVPITEYFETLDPEYKMSYTEAFNKALK